MSEWAKRIFEAAERIRKEKAERLERERAGKPEEGKTREQVQQELELAGAERELIRKCEALTEACKKSKRLDEVQPVGEEVCRSLTKAGLIVSLDADGNLYVGGPDGIGKHGQAVERCRDVLIAYLQQEQRQRVMQDLAALEDFCDTDCQYLKTFRAVNGELQRWCHAGNAAGDKRQWLTARLFSLRECPRREAPVYRRQRAQRREGSRNTGKASSWLGSGYSPGLNGYWRQAGQGGGCLQGAGWRIPISGALRGVARGGGRT